MHLDYTSTAHRTESVKHKLRDVGCRLAIIPGGLTSRLQPMDVGINKPFKAALKAAWHAYMMEQTAELSQGKSYILPLGLTATNV